MSLAQQLQAELEPVLIQANWVFAKLTKEDMPYYFVEWAKDDNFQWCLYYGFEARKISSRDYVKRVPLSELANAITICAHKRSFDRVDFEDCCPVARAAGSCGFAIVGRCMELLGLAEYTEDEHCFTLIGPERAAELMKEW